MEGLLRCAAAALSFLLLLLALATQPTVSVAPGVASAPEAPAVPEEVDYSLNEADEPEYDEEKTVPVFADDLFAQGPETLRRNQEELNLREQRGLRRKQKLEKRRKAALYSAITQWTALLLVTTAISAASVFILWKTYKTLEVQEAEEPKQEPAPKAKEAEVKSEKEKEAKVESGEEKEAEVESEKVTSPEVAEVATPEPNDLSAKLSRTLIRFIMTYGAMVATLGVFRLASKVVRYWLGQ
ncbi:hypothetical protein BESB_025750 [Besnoitia besnoiti]|uniref:Transmembrane protein n=1 Tax=Besnoitia besnoiti TaxID=94643 RepID=A0A2A9M5L9_BESBE|nr:uncharacterized protein BESB_025750 [Besnoitia besnoiti]PFH31601.1 hypothetical protein BESB_025750 [Besnoitia besnoiti]